ncbi:ergothioneine biosynthesis glutamate--cysteine ligase EgtA [Nocardia paucivorans]|uniref:ergothioneine biosynthesis glutamate--cysteine ligase EgtA n=1 Tax=Nocardia paucivorans TaxID=114259 RepID=UPI00031EB0A9|nr:ergothioneine biosynthesis glutamate--cysteine ligase EgtA [Nocardia paucivorans]
MAVTLEHPKPDGGSRVSGELSARAAAEAYTGGVCFKLGPPTLIGAELEWLSAWGSAPPTRPLAAPRPPLAVLADALGPYAPRSIVPDSPASALPGGSRVTIEPGGQIELSSAPYPSATVLCARLSADHARLRDLLAARSIRLVAAAADPERRARRLLRLPRYGAMERHFAGIGPFGKLMMCNTAATQVSVDSGADRTELAARWRALYTVGPALVAAFACSPVLRGAPVGDWASQRMRTWLRLDNARTRPPAVEWADPVVGYARWALDAPLLCVRRRGSADAAGECEWSAPPGATFADWISGALDDEIGRRPDSNDLDYHLTTLFPPVRASGHLEVRYIDAQPGAGWAVVAQVFEALMSTPTAVADATAAAESTAERWLDAARHGLTDPELRASAVAVLEAAAAHTCEPASRIHAAIRRCRAGTAPGVEDAEERT